jgi:UDP-N-acetylglucosamine:LPS N-acetylglucosamine transferase
VPLARARVPDLRFLVVTGPRIDPGALPSVAGADVRGFVPDLYLRMAAADVAVVQGGLTTTMELTAARVPFIYVPLVHHFEQNFHVRHRLERYRAGQCASYDQVSDPEWLAETLVKLIDTEVSYRPVETGGAARAATLLAEMV